MRREIVGQELRWIDVVDPDADDLRFLREDLGFHPLDVAECEKPSHLPKVEPHPTYVFLVIHAPAYVASERTTVSLEFDIFVSTEVIVTVHAGSATFLSHFFETISTQDDARQRTVGRGAAYLLYSILDRLFEGAFPMLDRIVEKLSAAEQRIFSGDERRMVVELSAIQRDLLGFRSILRPQRHLYEASALNGDWSTPTFGVVFRSLHGKLNRLWDYLETLWERSDTLAATNAALLNHKLNEFVKNLTILGALFIPFGLIAQTIAFLDADVAPPNRVIFWGIIGVMLVVAFAIMWKARHRNIL